MQSTLLVAAIFIASCTLSTGASAQTVYRCGDMYSQAPCGEGKTLDTGANAPNDAQARERKKATDAQTKREAALAIQLERERLQRETAERKLADAQRKALEKAQAAQRDKAHDGAKTSKSTASANHGTHKKKKNKEPEFFTAKDATPAKP
jgi:hypothetical protein